MKRRSNMVALSTVIGLAVALVFGHASAAVGETIKLHRAQGVEQGSGEATILNNVLTIRVNDLKPSSVYTAWYVNMDPKHEMAGVGPSPYMFKTDRKGAATFKAKLDQHPAGKWQMLVIVRHPSGDPQDMQHKEDALWASLTKTERKSANPCTGAR